MWCFIVGVNVSVCTTGGQNPCLGRFSLSFGAVFRPALCQATHGAATDVNAASHGDRQRKSKEERSCVGGVVGFPLSH